MNAVADRHYGRPIADKSRQSAHPIMHHLIVHFLIDPDCLDRLGIDVFVSVK